MGLNVAQKLIQEHLVAGDMEPGSEIGLRIDQTLTQDATGTMVMLELEALGVDRVKTELSAQYVDHNILQTDERNMADHLFLRSASRRFGLWYSKPGNGVSHPTHMEHFGVPGATLAGSDSHTCAAGSLGMLAIGFGGLEVALAMAGEPLYIRMPEIWGVRLTGALPEWVSAKDVILEMLRRHGVSGGRNRIVEYYGPGLDGLSAMDRHVIANMGAELGATTSVFPADHAVYEFLDQQNRAADYREVTADPDATYDIEDEIDLATLEPLIARPTSPGNVTPVRDVQGAQVDQVVVGSSANPGVRDFAVVAALLREHRVHTGVSLDVNPSSRQVLTNLIKMGSIAELVRAGARLHQTGCLGCIGMGQAPAARTNSLRTFPRNFPGRSGTSDDQVWLCSPETAAAAALTGQITDPRELPKRLDVSYPSIGISTGITADTTVFEEPLAAEEARQMELEKAESIAELPDLDPLPAELSTTVALKAGDDVSTDEILPAGAQVLPYRSNIPRLADFVFAGLDPGYPQRAQSVGRHVIVAGDNYGQGSSREHAVIAPRYLGLSAVVAKSYARIHWQNLVNFGVVPLEFTNSDDYDEFDQGDEVEFSNLHDTLTAKQEVVAHNRSKGTSSRLQYRMSPRQIDVILAGGQIPYLRAQRGVD